jgi:NAD(P)-dependent dehydrogenase (short-subunit alcohol dehydrogenase family)
VQALDGRVAVITGAGRGLGREHALLMASHGARVVVNDVGGTTSGEGSDTSVAQRVVDEIVAAGGEAVANTDSVSDWDGAKRLIETAVDSFGRLDVLVNNAGILRDRMLVNMSEQEWDGVIDVHLKGTFCPTRHAVAYWRDQSKAHGPVGASVINTSSGSGLFNNVGQTNYGAAKSAIATFSLIAAKEVERYGVRVNAIAPIGRTRLTQQTPGLSDTVAAAEGTAFDVFDPSNVSPLVAYLALEECPFTGTVFHVYGGRIDLIGGWSPLEVITKEARWELDELQAEMKQLLQVDPAKAGKLLSEVTSPESFSSIQ